MAGSVKLNGSGYDKVPIEDCIPEKGDTALKYGFGVRHVQLIIFMVCLAVSIIGRGHMGVTIVAMTSQYRDDTAILNSIHNKNKTNIEVTLRNNNATENDLNNVLANEDLEDITKNVTKYIKHIETYDWPKSIQEMILSGFFLGYSVMMFPMGLVCQRYGGKLPLQISLFTSAILSFIMPWMTMWGGWKAVCFCRVLQGGFQAGTYPCIQALLAKWVPINERAGLSSCVHTGLNIGTIIGYQMAGFLAASTWGWPSSFYVVGGICSACFLLLTIFGAANPLEHKNISQEERNYIMATEKIDKVQVQLKTPWKSILRSRHLWATIITHSAGNAPFVFFFNQIPSYLHYIFGINVRDSGVISSSPYIGGIFTILAYGWISDYCTNKGYISLKNGRIICNSLAQISFTLFLLLSSYTTNTTIAVACLITSMTVYMGIISGCLVNYIDLSPNFSGTLMAMGNTCGNILAIFITVVVSYIITDMTDVTQWRTIFFMLFALCLAGIIVFAVFVSTDIQPWNYGTNEPESCVADTEEYKKKESEEPLKCIINK